MADTTVPIPANELENMTECAICKEVYTDPRLLPCCAHTFCFRCIDTNCIDKLPGDDATCPLCRQWFIIPEPLGISELPKNIYVNTLVEWRKAESDRSHACDSCDRQPGTSNRKRRLASSYCISCGEKLCDVCDGLHTDPSQLTCHKKIKLHADAANCSIGQQGSVAFCLVHPKEGLHIYCRECNTAICIYCHTETHSTHQCADFLEVAAEIQQRAVTYSSRMTLNADKCAEIFDCLSNGKRQLAEEVSSTDDAIHHWADQLKAMIDERARKLVVEISTTFDRQQDVLDHLRLEAEGLMSRVEHVGVQICDALANGSSSADLLMVTNGTLDKADELLASCSMLEGKFSQLGRIKINFKPMIDCLHESIGSVDVNFISFADTLQHPVIIADDADQPFATSSADDHLHDRFTYPTTTAVGSITVSDVDLQCLDDGALINDVIIDFYTMFLYNEILTPPERAKTHIFSSFFYGSLTKDATAREKIALNLGKSLSVIRHVRVKRWTKNADIFSKEFIFVPVLERGHWLLAVICFPNLGGHQIQANSPAVLPNLSPVPQLPACAADVMLAGDVPDDRKTPCILIFDSDHKLPGNCWMISTNLRSYLQVEWDTRKALTNGPKVFDNRTMKGARPICPQQTNDTDGGIYLLQYMELFFKRPIHDFTLPIRYLQHWFHAREVAGKRCEISRTATSLMRA